MQETINTQESEEVKIFSMSEVQSREVSWLWYPYGNLTIIQGDPGEGKTTFVLNLAYFSHYGGKPRIISQIHAASYRYLTLAAVTKVMQA